MNALPPNAVITGASAWPNAGRAMRLVRRLGGLYFGLVVVLLAVAGLRVDGIVGVAAAAVLLPLAGLLATGPMAVARARPGEADDGRRLAWLSRRPQGVIVPAISLSAALVAWAAWPVAGPGAHAMLLGGGAVVLTFPLLVAERIMAGMSRAALPEAGGLQALLLVPVIAIPVAGLLQILAGLGFWWARPATGVLLAYLCVVAAELAVRSLARWFLPLPAPGDARAAVDSVVALLLQPGRFAPDGLAAPIGAHLGLDFSRSWALRYMRSASGPVVAVLALIGWALTGVSLVDLDRRGVYERLGEPVAVWAPGSHLGLPWPLGRVRRVDLGVVHTVTLGGDGGVQERSDAEGPAPVSADRLWNQVHPSEVSYLIASLDTAGGQGFQAVSVDLKVLYRTGLDDASALRAAYAVAFPDALVRAEAGRLLARVFAGQVLAGVLGEGRETMADGLRSRLQSELDALGSGIEVVAIVIEAIHPPPGAAEAYHNVQAAEIIASTAIATERGRAQATAAFARQASTDLVDGAQGAAAETVGGAAVASRVFTADREAARVGGPAFLLERYLGNLSTSLARSPLVIVDHRLGGVDAPVIDLRPFGAPPARPADDD